MENYRDFQGKDLDECIAKATEYFGMPRENLEIEIVQDAKTGIFGIVGARRAKIRARRARVEDAVANLLQPEAQAGSTWGAKVSTLDVVPGPKRATSRKEPALPVVNGSHGRKRNNRQPERPVGDLTPFATAPQGAHVVRMDMCAPPGERIESMPEIPWDALDHEKMEERLKEIVQKMISSIAGKPVAVRVDLSRGKPRAMIDWKGDAGLLIGREGQTLLALQYLASRLLSQAMGTTLRVQLDIGHYRMRQDDHLRENAKSLAKKVRISGKPLSTRPLSSYHRRVIHVCLQPDPDVQTRSIGDGPLKRVLISPKRTCPQ